jgi:predicted RND superfamily exporter protein
MKWSRHWPWLLLLIPIGLGLLRLRFDVEVMNLLPDQFPVVRGLKLYQTNFANARELIITIKSDQAELAESAARAVALALRAATNLTVQVTWQPLWLENPGQSAEFVAYAWFNQPPHIFGEVTNRLAQTNLANVLRETREALTTSLSPQDLARRGYDPFNLTQLPETASGADSFGEGAEFFSSSDGTFRVVFVEAKPDIASYRRCTVWLNDVKRIAGDALAANSLSDQVSVRYTGRPAFVTEIANGMEHDMTSSVTGTMLIIAGLFWWAHRRWLPLLWILTLLIFILGGTMALGGLIFGTLSVISMGFAAILLGLAVDYGLVLYQESQAAPHLSAREVRDELFGSILWSAVTTAGAFAILNFGGLPGLGQLGTLVAVGVALAAVVMLYAYLPPLVGKTPAAVSDDQPQQKTGTRIRVAWGATILLAIVSLAVLSWRHPRFDNSADALRPQNSLAYAAVEEIKQRLKRTQEPIWVLAVARDEAEMARKLALTRAALERSVSNQLVASFTLPDSLWPNRDFQSANRQTAAKLSARRDELRAALAAAGFTSNSFALTENLLRTWRSAAEQPSVFWPTNDNSRWVLEKFVTRNPNTLLALGLIYRDTNTSLATLTPSLLELAGELAPQQIYVSGWEMLGYSVFNHVKQHFPRVLVPMMALLIVSLWLAFRHWTEMVLSIVTLAFSGVLLWTVMALAGWSWNLLNLMALPLLLGSGVDYSIHMQLALRRHHGDAAAVRRSVGRALFVCGATTVAGFGSLAWSNNAGMASLGKVCATGIACCMFTAICLLPTWWRTLRKN